MSSNPCTHIMLTISTNCFTYFCNAQGHFTYPNYKMLDNLYIVNCTISLILIFEIFKYYKNNSIIRIQFIGLLASLLLLNLYNLLLYDYWYSFLINTTATLGIAVFILNIFSLLFYYKINKRAIYAAFTLYVVAIFFLVLKLYTHQGLKEVDYTPFISNTDKVGNGIKGIINIIFASFFLIYCIVILKKLNSEFYYHKVLKKWIRIFLIFLTICLVLIISNFFDQFNTINKFMIEKVGFDIVIQEFLYLFVIFRPNFLDANELKYSIANIMDLSQKNEISEIVVTDFFNKKYYLQTDASLSKFAQLTTMTNDEINDFMLLKYHQNFIDLVNIHRIQHFILLIDQGENKEYTIEYLGNQSGFSTRQALYLSFKKFKGCSPSDYIASLNSL